MPPRFLSPDVVRGLNDVNVKCLERVVARELQPLIERFVSEGEAPSLESLSVIFLYCLELLDSAREVNLYKEGPEVNPVLTTLALIHSKLLMLSTSKSGGSGPEA